MAQNYSREIAARINDFLTNDDWKFRFDEEDGVFRFGLNIGTRLKSIEYMVFVHDDSYNVDAISPIGADDDDPESLARMAEFTCRANFGLRSGNFELDFRDGELRYKCHITCADALPSKETIGHSIALPASMFRRYAGAILTAALTGESVADAVEKCEE